MGLTAPDAGHGSGGRILELDSVRGLAAVAVLFTHLPRGFWFGETGVDLFFVLSGFLITSIILRNHSQPGFLRVFYFRRSLRIFPIYYLALVAVIVLNEIRKTPGDTSGVWRYFFYVQNVHHYWQGTGPHVDLPIAHTWTLAIEEQFYLLWPALIVVFGKRWSLSACIGFVFLPVLLRSFGLDRHALMGHTDGLALGALLAFGGNYSSKVLAPKNAPRFLALAVGASVAYILLWRSLSGAGGTGKQMVQDPIGISLISLAYLGVVGFVIAISGSRYAAALRFGPLVWIGTISYGLYLYHWIAYGCLDTIFKFRLGYLDPWWLDVVKITVSFMAAAASWYAIERPLMRLKDSISYGRRGSLACHANTAIRAARCAADVTS